MATSESKWTVVDGNRVPYLEGGRRNGPDVLFIPLRAGLAVEEAVWSAIINTGRAVAFDLPAGCPPSTGGSFVIKAIEVFRLRHPHLAASEGLGAVALAAAVAHPSAFESLILATDHEASAPANCATLASLLPLMPLPTLVIAAHEPGSALALSAKLPRGRMQMLDREAPWPHCARAICAWIDGDYRSVPFAASRR